MITQYLRKRCKCVLGLDLRYYMAFFMTLAMKYAGFSLMAELGAILVLMLKL